MAKRTIANAEHLSLKRHPEFNERWVQDYLKDNLSALKLGNVELLGAEKRQPRGGRVDLLLHDPEEERRYEVELMLGATDPSHILRCIEYWDEERRRYPAYKHIAILIAEDITSRFLNLISLLGGSIPIIAYQLSALRIDDKIILHFTRILDHAQQRTDDEYELGRRSTSGGTTDRAAWEQRVPTDILHICDEVAVMAAAASGVLCRVEYTRRFINFYRDGEDDCRVFALPAMRLIHIGVFVDNPAAWMERVEETGLPASIRRGGRVARVTVVPGNFETHRALIAELIADGFNNGLTDITQLD
jgi:hypothetical protein